MQTTVEPRAPTVGEAVEETPDASQDATVPPEPEPLAEPEPEPPPEPEPEPPPEPEEEPLADVIARCAPAQDKLIEIGQKINGAIAQHMQAQRKAWIKKCERRVEAGDTEFRDDLRCVAEAGDLDEFIRCDGWTDWPGM